MSHIQDVENGINFAIEILRQKAVLHDFTKCEYSDLFFREFKEGFKKTTEWWELHQKTERHHLKNKEYVQEDVNLFDIIEMIIDGVMAGMARKAEYTKEEIPDIEYLLKKAYDNTIKLYVDNVKVKD